MTAPARSVRFYANEELVCVGPGRYELRRHDGSLIVAFAAISDEAAQNSPGVHRMIRNALEGKTTAATGEREPPPDEAAGIAWWNGLTETERAYWLREAGSAVVADAWVEWKRRHPVGTGRPPAH